MLLNRRYLRIVLFFARLALQIIFWEILLRNIGLRKFSTQSAASRYLKAAHRYRMLAVSMGGILIKVGQFLSARVDVMPIFITEELSDLQDEVPAEDFSAIETIIIRDLGKPPSGDEYSAGVFEYFEETPLAAASLGQVHRARLFSGEHVVVKVQRPNIKKIVDIDLAALRTAVGWLKHWRAVSRRANVEALLDEFSITLFEELDYVAEARNASRFAEIFKDDPGVRIPEVYSDFSTKCVLTLEDVFFIKITDYEAISAAGINTAEVATRLLNTYLHQIFIAHFFHADPHPGNLFVEPLGLKVEDPDSREMDQVIDWRLVFVDFGMVGHISPEAWRAGREAILALTTQDPVKLIHSFVALDMLLPGADVDRLADVYRVVFERYWGKTMDELRQIDHREMHKLMHQFRDLLYEMPFQVPENLIYLGRCIAILSGMCTGLHPDFNLFSELVPFAKNILAEEVKDEGLEFWLSEMLKWGRKMAAFPGRIDRTLARLESGDLAIITRMDDEQFKQVLRLTTSINRLAGGILISAMVIMGTLLFINDQHEAGILGWGIGVIVFLWGVLKGNR
jgi:predicted unusual protein kinase regulating ubiquinone biosynthesis (AarF/ABC1/UbiB family)